MKKIMFFFLLLSTNLCLAQTVGLYEVDLIPTSTNLSVSGGNTITVNRVLANCLPNYSSACETNFVNYTIEIVLDNGIDQYELLPTNFNYIEGKNCSTTQAWYQPGTFSLDMVVPCSVPTGNYMLKVICSAVYSVMSQQNSQITPSTVHVKAGGTTIANAVISSQVGSADIASVSVTNSSQYISGITFSTTNSTCSDLSTGSATANIVEVGGTGSYSYLWSNGQTGPTATGLSAGTYTVVITDINSGCSTSSSDFNSVAQIGNDYSVSASLSAIHICDGSSGQISSSVSSGVGPYDYSWNTGQTTTYIPVSTAGTYSLNVEDANGCTASASVDIIESENPTISLPEVIRTCNKYYELCGQAIEDPNGNYTYRWYYNDQVLQQMTIVANEPCFAPVITSGYGFYTLKVMNEYGCMSSHTIEVLPGKGCSGADPNPGGNSSGLIATVYPNPIGAGESLRIEMDSESETSLVEIIDLKTGKIIFQSVLEYGQPIEHVISSFATKNAPAVYCLKIYNDTDVVTKRLVVK